ncbi:MAG TPA: type IV pilus twitching motility protein PilT [Armatimonadota bacterium]|nr:type IV pilus twitching motility protein PilT [Armatimonadota bacterium]
MDRFLEQVLRDAFDKRCSDVFIKENAPPTYRLHGKVLFSPFPIQDKAACQALAESVMTEKQIRKFEDHPELDISLELPGLCRFRCNIFKQRGGFGMCLRIIPLGIKTLDDLGMPAVLKSLCQHRQGLVLVTGPTGSGKSTTLAAMIDYINDTREANIVTVEDPLEFVHPDKKCIVNQREVGLDTESFQDALRHVLRQAPDVILIGEMRDAETFQVALQAGETGHLVFSTLHTASAYETLDRIANMFPPHDKPQIALRLANSLRGVISQKLVPRADGGRIAAIEIMVVTPTVSKLLEEGRSGQIYPAIAEGSFYGMQTMNQCLTRYFRAGVISEEDALQYAGNVTELRQMLRRQ